MRAFDKRVSLLFEVDIGLLNHLLHVPSAHITAGERFPAIAWAFPFLRRVYALLYQRAWSFLLPSTAAAAYGEDLLYR